MRKLMMPFWRWWLQWIKWIRPNRIIHYGRCNKKCRNVHK